MRSFPLNVWAEKPLIFFLPEILLFFVCVCVWNFYNALYYRILQSSLSLCFFEYLVQNKLLRSVAVLTGSICLDFKMVNEVKLKYSVFFSKMLKGAYPPVGSLMMFSCGSWKSWVVTDIFKPVSRGWGEIGKLLIDLTPTNESWNEVVWSQIPCMLIALFR